MRIDEKRIRECFQGPLQYSIQNVNGNRSSKRTDILNDKVVALIMPLLPDPGGWKVCAEERIPCARRKKGTKAKTFTVDLLFLHVATGRKIYVLIKSIEASYNKNKENFANTTIGEVQRIYGRSEFYGTRLCQERKNDATLFLTFIAEELPMGNKVEKINLTCVDIDDLRLFNKNIHQATAILSVMAAPTNKAQLLNNLGGVKNLNEFIKDLKGLRENVEQILCV